MAESRVNVFQMLDDEKSNAEDPKDESKVAELSLQSTLSQSTDSAASDDVNWTVQSSTRTRRLVPGWKLPKQEGDSPRNKPLEVAKKKVVRFTRDELLNLRKPTKVLPVMREMADIVSIRPLDPVCATNLDPDDIYRLWHADKQGAKDMTRGRGKAMGGRGKDDEQNGNVNEWQRGVPSNKGPWDDSQDLGGDNLIAGTLDLSDFAAMALRFQSETHGLSLTTESTLEEDGLNSLILDQKSLENIYDDDEDQVPEWADGVDDTIAIDDIFESLPIQTSSVSTSKRSLLLETLNVTGSSDMRSDSYQTPMAIPSIEQIQQQPLYPPFLQAMQPQPVSIEWLYTDPQNNVQGPFTTDSMRRWHEEGYFSRDLPIKLRHWTTFYRLGTVYLKNNEAFRSIPMEPLTGVNPQSLILDQHRMLEEQKRKEQAILEQRQEQIRQEQIRQEQIRQDQIRQEQARQDQIRQEQMRQEQIRQEQIRQEQLRQEQIKLEQIRQEQIRQEQIADQQRQQEEHSRQQALEQQRQLLHEQQKREAKLKQQTPIEQQQKQSLEPQRQLVEQKRTEKQGKEQQFLSAAPEENNINQSPEQPRKPSASVAPWAKRSASNTSGNLTMSEIQQMEEAAALEAKKLQQESLKNAKSNDVLSASVWGTPSSPAASPKTKSLVDIQIEEEQRRKEEALKAPAAPKVQEATSQAPSSMSFQLKSLLGMSIGSKQPESNAGQSSGSGWGPRTTPAPSLSEIMQQESLQTGGETDQGVKVSNSSSWAAKALAGTGGTSSSIRTSVPPPAQKAVLTKSSNAISSATAPVPTVWKQEAPVPENRSESMAIGPTPAAASAARPSPKGEKQTSSKKDDFGGKGMSPEMAQWCSSQLKKINGSEDLTLMQFCMTLQSATEIREYLAVYLGSTPQVSQFATEYIKRKEGGLPSVSSTATSTPSTVQPAGFVSVGKKKKTK